MGRECRELISSKHLSCSVESRNSLEGHQIQVATRRIIWNLVVLYNFYVNLMVNLLDLNSFQLFLVSLNLILKILTNYILVLRYFYRLYRIIYKAWINDRSYSLLDKFNNLHKIIIFANKFRCIFFKMPNWVD